MKKIRDFLKLAAKKRLFHCFAVLLSGLTLLTLNGCKASQASDGRPTVLRYAYSPSAEQLQGGGLRINLMRKYLEDQLHMPIEVVRVEGYSSTIEAMRAEKVDLANYGGLGYIIAAQKAGAEAIVARGNDDGSLGGYRSLIAVPKNSPIHSMQDLKQHAKDLDFAFADPASTSGNLYPRVGLLSIGIDAERDFKKVVFSGTHIASVMTLVAGKVDASAFSQSIYNRLVREHKLNPDDLRIVWTSDLIPNEPYAVRKGLPESLKKEIQAALIAIPTKDPALWASISSLYHTPDSGVKYIAVNDATYNGLRKYASQVKDFSFVEK